MSDREWQRHGACASRPDLGPNDFFLESLYVKNSKRYRAARDRAKAVCAVCPVIDVCLEWAVETHQLEGIWGGLTACERRSAVYPRKRVGGKLTYTHAAAS